MTNAAADWDRVKQVFQAALERSLETRPKFLDETCGDDAALRAEVESLLRAHEQAGSFAEQPAVDELAGRPLQRGERLGSYEIVALLGIGGMGEVYQARDTRLDRTVAIKVLRAHLASDPTQRARFEREARLISQLNHPHICTLYDVGRDDGTDYLVVECLNGQTLAQRLRKGGLPMEQALTIAIQIAGALDAAHTPKCGDTAKSGPLP